MTIVFVCTCKFRKACPHAAVAYWLVQTKTIPGTVVPSGERNRSTPKYTRAHYLFSALHRLHDCHQMQQHSGVSIFESKVLHYIGAILVTPRENEFHPQWINLTLKRSPWRRDTLGVSKNMHDFFFRSRSVRLKFFFSFWLYWEVPEGAIFDG